MPFCICIFYFSWITYLYNIIYYRYVLIISFMAYIIYYGRITSLNKDLCFISGYGQRKPGYKLKKLFRGFLSPYGRLFFMCEPFFLCVGSLFFFMRLSFQRGDLFLLMGAYFPMWCELFSSLWGAFFRLASPLQKFLRASMFILLAR